MRKRLSRVVGCAVAPRSCRPRLLASPAGADPNNNTARKLTKAVTLEGVVEHLEALQAIADANGGNRAAGLPGYAGSVDYVVERLEAAGYDPIVQEFEFDFFDENSELQRISPNPRDFVNGTDFLRNTFDSGTPEGEATGALFPVGLVIDPALPRQLEHQRLRGSRLRRYDCGQHRLDAARHLRVRRQGAQRPGCRGRRRGDHERRPAWPHRTGQHDR